MPIKETHLFENYFTPPLVKEKTGEIYPLPIPENLQKLDKNTLGC